MQQEPRYKFARPILTHFRGLWSRPASWGSSSSTWLVSFPFFWGQRRTRSKIYCIQDLLGDWSFWLVVQRRNLRSVACPFTTKIWPPRYVLLNLMAFSPYKTFSPRCFSPGPNKLGATEWFGGWSSLMLSALVTDNRGTVQFDTGARYRSARVRRAGEICPESAYPVLVKSRFGLWRVRFLKMNGIQDFVGCWQIFVVSVRRL